MQEKELIILSPFEQPDVRSAINTTKSGAFPLLHSGRYKDIIEKRDVMLSCFAMENVTNKFD